MLNLHYTKEAFLLRNIKITNTIIFEYDISSLLNYVKVNNMKIDISRHNAMSWDKEALRGSKWTKPLNSMEIEKAKRGYCKLFLTPSREVPPEWLEGIANKKVLCLGGGGGQQSAILALLGADVTVVDISKEQLENDKFIAKTYNLNITTIQGDMRNLFFLDSDSFHLIIHPISNIFVDDILPVWKECHRILKTNGVLISGIINSLLYLFDFEDDCSPLTVKHSIPYSTIDSICDEELENYLQENLPLEFSHTLEEQIQGQIDAGFSITGFLEDNSGGQYILDKYINSYILVRAEKL